METGPSGFEGTRDRAGDGEAIALGLQVVEATREMHQAVTAADYETAAAARDRRQVLVRRMAATGNERVSRDVQLALTDRLRHRRLFEPAEAEYAPTLLAAVVSAPLPVRWIVPGTPPAVAATLQQRLDTGLLGSAYFAAYFPAVTAENLAGSTHPHEWLHAIAVEARRSRTVAVRLYGGVAHLAARGLADRLRAELADPLIEFVVCTSADDASAVEPFTRLPGVTVVR